MYVKFEDDRRSIIVGDTRIRASWVSDNISIASLFLGRSRSQNEIYFSALCATIGRRLNQSAARAFLLSYIQYYNSFISSQL